MNHDEYTKRFPCTVVVGDLVTSVYADAVQAAGAAKVRGGTVVPTRNRDDARVIARQVCWLRDNGATSMRRTDGLQVFANGEVG